MKYKSSDTRLVLVFLAAFCASPLAATLQAQLPVQVPDRETPVDFHKEILPIFKANCLACHNASEAEGDLVLESPETIKTGGLSGPAVVEGKSDESLLFQAAAHAGEVVMPPDGNAAGAENLSPEQLGLVKLWIDQGAVGPAATSDQPAIEWRPLAADVDPIYAAAIAPHGRYVAAGWGNRLLVYEVSTQRLVAELVDPSLGDLLVATTAPPAAAHLDLIHSLAMSSDGQRLASGGFRTVKIWRKQLPTATREPLGTAAGRPPEVPTDSLSARWKENSVEIVKTRSGEVVRTLDFGRGVARAAVSADGKRVAAIGPGGAGRLWNAESGEVIAELPGRMSLRDRAYDAGLVAGIRERQRDQTQRDLEAAQQEKQKAEEQIKQALSEVEAADKALAEKRKTEEEKLAARKAAEEKLAMAEAEKTGADEAKKSLDEATKGAEAATKEREEAEQNVQAAKDALELNKPSLERAGQTIEATQTLLAEAQQALDTAASARDAAGQQLSEGAAELRAVGFAPDGKEVVVVDAAGNLCVYAAADGSPLVEIDSGASEPLWIEYRGGHEVRLQTADAIYQVATRPKWALERTIGSLDDAETIADRVTALDFSPDGKRLAVGGGEPSRSGQIKLFDVETGAVLLEFDQPHSDTVLSLAFSSDGSRLASGGADRFAKVFDSETGNVEKTLEGHTGHVLAVAWHVVGRTLATASADGTVKIWNTDTAEQQRTIEGFNSPLGGVTFVGTDDTCVLSGKGIVTSRKTDGSSGPSYAGATDFVHVVRATPDGKLIMAGGEDGVLHLWKMEGQAVATFTAQERK